jgi:peptide/nickel transport system substrate-binding protein
VGKLSELTRGPILMKRIFWQMLSLLLISVLALAGCSNSGTSGNSSSEPTSTNKQNKSTDPVSGGTLRIGTLMDVINLGNPPTMQRGSDKIFNSPALESLFRMNDAGEVEGFLAEGYKVEGQSVTITLKKGIKFHDGADLNAEAVKWNLEKSIEAGRSQVKNIASIDVVDEHTVKINLSSPDSLLIPNMTLSTGMMMSPKSYEENGGEKWAESHPVGTGPFKFVSWERDKKITYEKFEGYWQQGLPYLDKIEFIPIPDTMSAVASFKNGDLDLLYAVEPANAKDLENSKFEILRGPRPTSQLAMIPDSAHENSILADVKVRKAVGYAIDFKSITETLGLGYYIPTFQLATEGSFAYNPDVEGYPYDPKKAKQLLAEAGYPDGFSITLYGLSNQEYSNLMTAIQGYLSKVGIEAKIEMMDQLRYDTMLTGGPEKGGWKDGYAIIPMGININEVATYNSLLGPGVSEIRLPVLNNPDEVKQLIGQTLSINDSEELKKVTHQIQELAYDKHAMVNWIYGKTSLSAKYPKVMDEDMKGSNWTPEKAWLQQ